MLFLWQDERERESSFYKRSQREQKKAAFFNFCCILQLLFDSFFPLKYVFHPRGLILNTFKIDATRATEHDDCSFGVRVCIQEDFNVSKITRSKLFLYLIIAMSVIVPWSFFT